MINYSQQRQQQNDDKIHRAAQLEASRYLYEKRTQREEKLDDWFFGVVALLLLGLFVFTGAADLGVI